MGQDNQNKKPVVKTQFELKEVFDNAEQELKDLLKEAEKLARKVQQQDRKPK